MQVNILLTKNGTALATATVPVEKEGDLKQAIGNVFYDARRASPNVSLSLSRSLSLWDCDLQISSAEE